MKRVLFYFFYLRAMRSYHQKKDYKEALKYYEKASKFLPHHAKNYFKIGMCYHKMRKYYEASTFMQKALDLDSTKENWKKQLETTAHNDLTIIKPQELWWKDILDLKEAIKKGGVFLEYLKLGEALAKMHRFFEAAQNYEKAISLCKETQKLAQLYYEMGFCYESSSKEALAQKAYEEAINHDEILQSKLYGIGVFHWKKARFVYANRAFLKSFEEKQALQKNDEFLFKLGLSFEKLYEYKQASIFYQKALEYNYHRPYTHFKLALMYETFGDFEKAALSYEEAIKRKNNFEIQWFHKLVFCLNTLGKRVNEVFLEIQDLLQKLGSDKNKILIQKAIYTHFYENLKIDEKTILYESFHGRLMSCNPYALFKSLIKDERFKDFTHIWVLSSAHFMKDEYKTMKNLIIVKRNSQLYLQYLASAKYLINNTTFDYYFIRKRGQFYLNTWHGTAFKTLGKYIKTGFMQHNNTQRNFLQTTHLLSPNTFMSKVLLEDYDIAGLYNGKCLLSGYPRVDLTLSTDTALQKKLKARLKIKEGEKVLLYAPTFRGHFGKANFEYESITKLIKELSVMPFKILFKGHYETLKYIEKEELKICDANDRELDTNELLSIVDVLITDYSSIAFDFMPLDKPIIYYCYDYEDYKKERGCYFDFKDLGLNYCKSVEEIKTLLNERNFLEQKDRFTHLKDKFFPLEDGNSSKRVKDFFFFNHFDEKLLYKTAKKKASMLFFAGAFMPNGITSAFKNMLASIDLENCNLHIAIEQNSIHNFPERMQLFKELGQNIAVLPKIGSFNLNLQEYELLSTEEFFEKRHNETMEQIFASAWAREWKRLYGESVFDFIVQYDGYNRYFSYLFAYAPIKAKKIIYAHNDMQGEFYKKFPYLRGIFYLYKRFDLILSVSKMTNAQNKDNLALSYEIPQEKFQTLRNFINAKEVLLKSDMPLAKGYQKYFKGEVFINIARLSVEKNQSALIRAFVEFHKQVPKARLLILGDGPLKENLKHLIKSCQAERYIFLLGFVANPYNFLKKSDYFVLSSKHEGLPLVLAEAMILKKKILCSNFACAKDFLGSNNEFGLVYEDEKLYEGLHAIRKPELKFKDFDTKAYNQEVLNEFIKVYGKENDF
ncbi:CDP-glycerol glycerophosphotransferase family protein [Campylobacter sp. MIT 21-1684]|uniref:CDP-glycerol glycerophosphotransferase family protein n=1 Tax=Campylobacter sp. MIT 21-1684 TaxID=2994322 RepID=UPI00224AFB81|nr:CDP-glycerol glycerophosphotransferase family protein [Campylobacter sp. MIT 21-1684]MCX2683308.1 CDP-glycerol glycerophosphotransferase family protein [Campylobacter sp. MIT 21-1684]